MSRKLTLKQEAFVRAYIETGNASEAYRRAYDAGKMKAGAIHSNAQKLLKHTEVALRIKQATEKIAAKHEVTVEKIISELASLGFSNMMDFMRVQDGGDAFVDFSALTRAQAAAIQEITVEEYKDGRGEDARDVKRVKFKLHDKKAALVDLGKHLGMFKQDPLKVELSFGEQFEQWLKQAETADGSA